ncbi:MAG: MoaD/ThiS family protein [bacterium]|nr:MoaD/ThiS family protein [bacterium]
MKIRVRIMLIPERVIRNETLEMELPEGSTVRELLAQLPLTSAEKKQLFKRGGSGLNDGMGVLVDRKNVNLNALGLDTPLSERNLVSLIHLITGG